MQTIMPSWITSVAIVLALVGASAASAADERKQLAFDVVERNAQQMTDVSDSLFYFGELGMQEFESTKLLKDTLAAAGFKVELGGAGMPTNVWAEYGNGRPKIAIVTEVDALPGGSQTPGTWERKPLVKDGPGHMEGHNTHGGVAALAAFAVKQVMQRYNLPGTVAISYGPAEEQIASRPFLVRAGYFKDVDAVIYLHIGEGLTTGYGVQNYAAISSVFTFHGKTAHGAVNPWDGKDAVDAVELMDIGFDKLREHLRPSYRAHRTITVGGIQPNIIPDKGQIWWFVRDASMPAAKETYDKLLKIAEGAALMTGTTWDVQYAASAWPQLASKTIAEAVQKNIDAVGMPKWTDEEQNFARDFQKFAEKPEVGLRMQTTPLGGRPQSYSSNDNGDVSWVVPAGILVAVGHVQHLRVDPRQDAREHLRRHPLEVLDPAAADRGVHLLAQGVGGLVSRPLDSEPDVVAHRAGQLPTRQLTGVVRSTREMEGTAAFHQRLVEVEESGAGQGGQTPPTRGQTPLGGQPPFTSRMIASP